MENKKLNPTHEVKELLKLNHKWEDLQVGDLVTLLPSAYGEADEHFTPGNSYKIYNLTSIADAPNENQIAIKARDGQIYGLPYSHFNVQVQNSANGDSVSD